MINEKMLEYLMLNTMLYDLDGSRSELAVMFIPETTLDCMIKRRIYLEDEFIHEYKPTVPIIKHPVKEITATEE